MSADTYVSPQTVPAGSWMSAAIQRVSRPCFISARGQMFAKITYQAKTQVRFSVSS